MTAPKRETDRRYVAQGYKLIAGWTWNDVENERSRLDISTRFVPLVSSHGVVAWGTYIPEHEHVWTRGNGIHLSHCPVKTGAMQTCNEPNPRPELLAAARASANRSRQLNWN